MKTTGSLLNRIQIAEPASIENLCNLYNPLPSDRWSTNSPPLFSLSPLSAVRASTLQKPKPSQLVLRRSNSPKKRSSAGSAGASHHRSSPTTQAKRKQQRSRDTFFGRFDSTTTEAVRARTS